MPDNAHIFSGLFNSFPIAIRVADASGNLVFVNPEYCRLYGYNKEELLGKRFTEVLVPEQREKAFQLFKKQFAEETKEGFPEHWRGRKKNGKEVMVSVSSYTLFLEEEGKFQMAIVKDVSNIARHQNQLEFQSSILNSMQDSVIVAGMDGKILYWNEGAVSLYGSSEEEALGQELEKLLPKFSTEDLLNSLNDVNISHEFLDWPYKRPDKKQVWVNSRITPLLNADKKAEGLIILCKNVTEQHKNKEEVRDQQNWLSSLLDSQSSYLIRQNSEGFLTYFNKSFGRCFLPDGNLLGKRFQDFLHPDDVGHWLENMNILNNKHAGKPRLELRMLSGKGEYVWVGWEFVHVYDHNSSFIGIQGVGVEVTERKNTEKGRDELLRKAQALNEELQANEEELRQSLEKTIELNDYICNNERKFKSLLENSFEAIILFDEAGIITYASPSIERTLGYSPEEMVGKKGMVFVHEDDKSQSRALLAQMMEKPGNRVYILQRVRRKEGNYIWIESYSTNLLYDENVKGIVSNFRDVTDRIESEIKIRSSEALLNQAQDVAKLGSTEFDLVTGKVNNSLGVFAIYDYDLGKNREEEFDGAAYVHPDDVSKFHDFFKNHGDFGTEWIKDMKKLPTETIEEVEAVPFEFRIISAAGRLKYLRSKHRLFTDEKGRAVKLIVTIQDVSEEKHRERLLDETSRISRIGGWELDLVHHEIFWTAQTYRLFEVPSTDNLTVEKAVSFYDPEYQSILQEALQALVAAGTPFDLELKMATAKGKEIWVRMMGQGEMVKGKVVLAKGTIQDISEKKQSEQEIMEYAERLRLATEAAGIGIWDWDLQTNEMVWDKQMRQLYWVPEDRIRPGFEDYQNALYPDDVLEMEAKLQEVFDQKKIESEFRIVSPTKEIRWLKSFAKVFDDDRGEPKRMVGLNWDISLLKQTEETLRHNNEELLKTNEELDHFVYSTSHNLRAPLTSILGIVNLMKSHPNLRDNSTYIDLIEKSVQKLDDTIQDITNYSRNTRIDVKLEVVDFEALVQGIVETLSFLGNAEKIKISYITPTNSEFLSDSSRLKMIFTNLISNAIKYSDPEQEDPFIFILIETKKNGVSIRVQDNGIGIAKEYQNKIFNMFYRASSKSTGSGLGLYIVKEAVHKLGGTIEVQSSPGKGTEFFIFLPKQV